MNYSERRIKLRALIDKGETIFVPGAYDAISAKLIEKTGFPSVYIGSYSIAASGYGFPDVGLLGMTEMVHYTKTIVDSVSIPVIADAENGFNNAANIWRTIRAFEQAGVSAIHIEDHEFGKHTNVKPVMLSLDQMVEKVRASVDARVDPNFLIVARTDVAWALNDVDEAVKRANAFSDAGADLVFLTGINPTKLKEIRQKIKGKVMIVDTAGFSVSDEESAGANVVLYYGFALYAAYTGVKKALEQFKETRDKDLSNELFVNVEEFEEFIGYQDFVFKAQTYNLNSG
jgi:2-methylisocitrate lyase-like PEP mutase family enzyme